MDKSANFIDLNYGRVRANLMPIADGTERTMALATQLWLKRAPMAQNETALVCAEANGLRGATAISRNNEARVCPPTNELRGATSDKSIDA